MTTSHHGLLRLAVAMVIAVPGGLLAQDQPTAFVHGFNSNGGTWQAASQRLASQYKITSQQPPNLSWSATFPSQASELSSYVNNSMGAATPLLVGHSNGGIVSREYAKTHAVAGIVTIGTPHSGAPLASNLTAYGQYLFETTLVVVNAASQFITILPSPSLASALQVGFLFGTQTGPWIVANLGIQTALPVTGQMGVSPYIQDLNGSANAAHEAATIPNRVGIVSYSAQYFTGGPFALGGSAQTASNTINIAALVATLGSWYYFGTADPLSSNYQETLNVAASLALAGDYLALWEPVWCAAISSVPLNINNVCWASDGVVPAYAQYYPLAGVPNLLKNGGPNHLKETSEGDGYLAEALSVYMHIPERNGPDIINPSVSITSPTNNATVAGVISIVATASDNLGISHVDFAVDGAPIGTVVAAPYQVTWNSAGVTNGGHAVSATAFDAAGNHSMSTATVNVSNGCGGCGDTTPPVVSVVAPADGSVLSGSVSVVANATDNVGVTQVSVLVDGTVIGTVYSPPYAVQWNSATVTNGWHTLTAIALDAVTNSGISAISVFVSNSGCGNCGGSDTLGPGESLSTLVSPSGRYELVYQGDGNVVLSDHDTNELLWASHTDGTTVGEARMNEDGNFVVYDAEHTPVCSTHTDGFFGATLSLHDDGNLVIYYNGTPIWAISTGGQCSA